MRWFTLLAFLCVACTSEQPREPASAGETGRASPTVDPASAPSPYGPGIHLLSACQPDATTCVRMTLNDRARPANAPLPIADSTGYASFALRVRGHLSGHNAADTVVVLHSNTDGMACTALGNAAVAVTGFTETGGAVVLTSAGPFTVDSSSLEFGCESCGVLVPQTGRDTVAILRTPSWDLRRVGLTPEQLSYDDAQTLFVRTGMGTDTACVAMRAVGQFEAVNGALCSQMTELGSFTREVKNFKFKPAEWLYQATGQRARLLLSHGACT